MFISKECPLGYSSFIAICNVPLYPFTSIGPTVPSESFETKNRQAGSQHGRLLVYSRQV